MTQHEVLSNGLLQDDQNRLERWIRNHPDPEIRGLAADPRRGIMKSVSELFDDEDTDMTIGIYTITNSVNGKVYVGSSVRIERRWREHRLALNNGTHVNNYLQNSWEKYGAENFVFAVVETLSDLNSVADLFLAEQRWMDRLNAMDRRFGYNIADVAGAPAPRKVAVTMTKGDETVSYPSIRAFAEAHGVPEKQVSAAVRGKQKTVHGWRVVAAAA